MADAEQIFNNCTLDLIVPDGLLDLPTQESNGAATGDEWLKQARDVGQRKQAFFDERLDFFLVLRFTQSGSSGSLSPNAFAPPAQLLSFLSHLQVALEASYIPPTPVDQFCEVRLPAPPARTSSSGQTPKARGLGIPLPIFPPQTPSPKPSTSETDKKYVYSEGTPLKSFIWGEDYSDEADCFRFLRSKSEKCWIAIYRIRLPVVYVRTEFNDPLLCLTTSITLRDKPLSSTPQRRSLLDLIDAAGPLPPLLESSSPNDTDVPPENDLGIARRAERGFLEEVNLLEGLSSEDYSGQEAAEPLYLPTSRLGTSARRTYSLPPITPASPADPKPKPSRSLPILRKSFRRILGLASGFHVRMRTILVPSLLLPEGRSDELETANDESTVVLSIEIESPSDSEVAFSVDTIEVYLKNEITKIRMIGWGEEGFQDPTKVFPLLVRPAEQYYLLYAVTFLRPPEMELSQTGEQDEYRKIVSFNIIGRPCTAPGSDFSSIGLAGKDKLSYITAPFLSRWNCRLDVDPRRRESMPPPDTTSDAGLQIIPIPPSPFPVSSPRARQAQDQATAKASVQVNTVAGPKRHTFAGTTSQFLLSPQRPMSLTTTTLSGTSGTNRLPSPLGKLGMKPWTVGTPLSTSSLQSPPLPPLPGNYAQNPNQFQSPPPTTTASSFPFPATVPLTPAFPSYGNQPLTPRPNSVTPSLGQTGSVGRGFDARRERYALPGMPVTPGPPMTPRPQFGGDDRAFPPPSRITGNIGNTNKDFVISISLVPPDSSPTGNPKSPQLIHPLDEFLLEMFVFNQSPYVRTLEATLPDRKRRREEKRDSRALSSFVDAWKPAPPAFMPLESKVRIGPLGPSTCQSVTMRFLAMLPGVHTIDGLNLTDLETGETIILRSVMDFAVLPRNPQSESDN